MSKEKYNQIIDEAYSDYCNSFNDSIIEPNSKEVFVNKCKHNIEYSVRWGLKIEERELSLGERTEILKDQSDNKEYFYDNNGNLIIESEWVLNKSNIPTKLITVTYNNETIEIYDQS